MENIKLKDKFIDEKTGIEYIRKGDFYFPNLVDSASVNKSELGKYGKLRLKYLLEHNKVEYTILWLDNKLRSHLLEIDKTANERFHLLMKQFAEQENITKELKNKVSEIMEIYPNLQLLFEDDKVMNLNEEECKMLQKLVSLYLQMSDYEDRKIFFLGARENYFYFKKLGIIKD